MTNFPVHTIESAPTGSQATLQGVKNAFGLIPNLAAVMGGAPALINSYLAVVGHFHGSSSLSSAEREALLLTNAVTNAAAWPVAFHSTMALKEGVSAGDVDAIRKGATPATPRIGALVALTRALITKRGHVDQAEIASFVAAGFRHDQVLEVVAGLAISVMANYAANVANPPLDAPFAGQAWQPSAR